MRGQLMINWLMWFTYRLHLYQVLGVFAEAAIFILNLPGNYRSSIGVLQQTRGHVDTLSLYTIA